MERAVVIKKRKKNYIYCYYYYLICVMNLSFMGWVGGKLMYFLCKGRGVLGIDCWFQNRFFVYGSSENSKCSLVHLHFFGLEQGHLFLFSFVSALWIRIC